MDFVQLIIMIKNLALACGRNRLKNRRCTGLALIQRENPMKSMAPNIFSTLLRFPWYMGVWIVANVPLNLGTRVISEIPSQL